MGSCCSRIGKVSTQADSSFGYNYNSECTVCSQCEAYITEDDWVKNNVNTDLLRENIIVHKWCPVDNARQMEELHRRNTQTTNGYIDKIDQNKFKIAIGNNSNAYAYDYDDNKETIEERSVRLENDFNNLLKNIDYHYRLLMSDEEIRSYQSDVFSNTLETIFIEIFDSYLSDIGDMNAIEYTPYIKIICEYIDNHDKHGLIYLNIKWHSISNYDNNYLNVAINVNAGIDDLLYQLIGLYVKKTDIFGGLSLRFIHYKTCKNLYSMLGLSIAQSCIENNDKIDIIFGVKSQDYHSNVL